MFIILIVENNHYDRCHFGYFYYYRVIFFPYFYFSNKLVAIKEARTIQHLLSTHQK